MDDESDWRKEGRWWRVTAGASDGGGRARSGAGGAIWR
jgi:hypothetical protein